MNRYYREMFACALTNKYSNAFGYWCFIRSDDYPINALMFNSIIYFASFSVPTKAFFFFLDCIECIKCKSNYLFFISSVYVIYVMVFLPLMCRGHPSNSKARVKKSKEAC